MPPTLVFIALAVMICALVRLIQIMQLHRLVGLGQAGVRELAELSGITDPYELQDIFGPPDMDRTWRHVTLDQIKDRRRLSGYLMSDTRLHWLAMAGSISSLLLPYPGMAIVFYAAAMIEAAAWISAIQLR